MPRIALQDHTIRTVNIINTWYTKINLADLDRFPAEHGAAQYLVPHNFMQHTTVVMATYQKSTTVRNTPIR